MLLTDKNCDFGTLSAFFNRLSLPILLIDHAGEIQAASTTAKRSRALFSQFSFLHYLAGKLPAYERVVHQGQEFELLIFPFCQGVAAVLVVGDRRKITFKFLQNCSHPSTIPGPLGKVVTGHSIRSLRKISEKVPSRESVEVIFLRSLVHEMRNDLTGIKGFAALLKKKLTQDAKSLQWIGNIMQSADHLHLLIQQLEAQK